jgi:hypothetical protein
MLNIDRQYTTHTNLARWTPSLNALNAALTSRLGKINLRDVRCEVLMAPEDVKDKLVEVLRTIQDLGGFADGEGITGETIPLEDLEDFDTQVAPVAITVLAKALGVEIPNDENVFLSPDGLKPLSVDAVCGRVADIVNCKGKKK